MTDYTKNWCVTINNYTEEQYESLINGEWYSYCVVAKEIAPDTGTPHLQIYVVTKTRCRIPRLKHLLLSNEAHCEAARGGHVAASVYCKKTPNFVEVGVLPTDKSGKRTDIDDFKDAVKGGLSSLKEIREQHSSVFAKYPSFVMQYLQDVQRPYPVESYPFRQWQADLNTKLNRPPCKRIVIFVVDPIGNSGKSWFARWYSQTHENAQYILPGKKNNLVYALNDSRVYFFDSPRAGNEFLPYTLFEELKNGVILSSKYQTHYKYVQTCHLVVLMNEMPDMTKLSADRYEIIQINENSNELAVISES